MNVSKARLASTSAPKATIPRRRSRHFPTGNAALMRPNATLAMTNPAARRPRHRHRDEFGQRDEHRAAERRVAEGRNHDRRRQPGRRQDEHRRLAQFSASAADTSMTLLRWVRLFQGRAASGVSRALAGNLGLRSVFQMARYTYRQQRRRGDDERHAIEGERGGGTRHATSAAPIKGPMSRPSWPLSSMRAFAEGSAYAASRAVASRDRPEGRTRRRRQRTRRARSGATAPGHRSTTARRSRRRRPRAQRPRRTARHDVADGPRPGRRRGER